MTPEQAQAALDPLFDAIWMKLQTKQVAYMQQHGEYWQGMALHASVPDCARPRLPDIKRKLSRHHRQMDDWSDFAAELTDSLPGTFEVHVYQAPAGWGYTLLSKFMDRSATWTRSNAIGPEAVHRTQPWVRTEKILLG